MTIHHIGYLVKDIDSSKKTFEQMGYSGEGTDVYDATRDVNIAFMKNGEYMIELVAPGSENSPVYKTLKKIGNSPYHICYETEDIDIEYENLREKGFLPVSEINPAVAINDRKVCFMFDANIGLIELVQK